MQYSYLQILSSVPKALRTSSNVTLRHESMRRSLSVAMPDSHAPPLWPLHIMCSDVHVERPLGVKRFENCWVSPFCSCSTGGTEITSRRPSLTSGGTSLAIPRAQTCLVQPLYNDTVRRTDTLTCQVINADSYYELYKILTFSSFEWSLYFDDSTKYRVIEKDGRDLKPLYLKKY